MVFPNVSRQGYTFVGWEEISFTNTHKVLKANYAPKTFTIHFSNVGGEGIADLVVTFDQQITLPEAMKTGYQFLAWTYEEETIENSFTYRFDHDIELVANYANVTFQIQFYPLNETVIPNLNVFYLEKIQDLPVPKKEGYQFLGWMNQGILVELPFVYTLTDDLELYASYVEEQILVEFQDFDGAVLKSQMVSNVQDATCEEPKRFGHHFSGWNRIDTEEKIIYTAHYEVGVYKITFASNSIQSIQSSTIAFGQTITALPVPSKDNYMFVGWFLDGIKIETPFVFNQDHHVTLFAHWEKTNFPSVAYSEIYDFGKKVDSVMANANQYQYTNVTEYLLKGIHSSFGSVTASSNLREEVKVDKANQYYEIHLFEDSLEMGYEIFRQEGDAIYHDVLDYNKGNYILSTQLIANLSDFIYDDLSFSELFDGNDSFRKIDNDHYLIYTSLGKLNNDTINMEMLAESIYLPKKIIEEICVEIEVIFSELTQQAAFAVEIKDFTFEIDDIKYTMSVKLSTIVNNINAAIIPFNQQQSNVFLKIPSTIDEITKTTDISNSIQSYESPDPHYYRVLFEKGLYEVIFSDFFSSTIEIYHEDMTEITYPPLWKNQEAMNNNGFLISASGIYYVKVKNPNIDDYTLAFKKISYESLADANNPLSLSSNHEISSEGKFDFAYFTISASADGILVLEASIVDLFVYGKGFYQMYTKIRKEDNKFYLPISLGENFLILGSSNSAEFTITTQVIYDNPDTTEDITIMPTLTTDFSLSSYLVGLSCDNDYFCLDVAASGVYTIAFETQNLIYKPYVTFYSQEGMLIYSNGNSLSLQPGVYYIKVSYVSNVILYHIKYEFISDQTVIVDFVMATYSESNPLTDVNVPKLNGVLPTPNSNIYHKFVLEATSTVFFNYYQNRIELLDEQMKIISFDYDHKPDIYRLSPGTYYVKIIYNGSQINYQYSFAACILMNPPVDDFPSDQFKNMSLEEIQMINLEYDGDIDYYHFSILEEKTYYFRFSINFALFRANEELVMAEEGRYYNKDLTKDLEVGDYYFIFFHKNNQTGNYGAMTIQDTPFS
jgi:uncharacterized repeat protein (TIGR02543 family)